MQSAQGPLVGASAGSSALNCPRCGYDQRGQAATWREACSLEGRCSECGLTFEWADLFSPVRNVPPWCIEHVPTKAIARGCVGTLMRSFAPWRFWSRLRLAHPIRPKRLMLYLVIVMIVPLLLSYIIVQSTVAIIVRAQIERELRTQMMNTASLVLHFEQLRRDWEAVRDHDAALAVDALPKVWGARDPQAMRPDLFDSQEEWEPVWQTTAERLDQRIESFRAVVEVRPTIHMPYALAVAEAILFPLSESSFGYIKLPNGAAQYPPPAQLYERLASLQQPVGGMTGNRSILTELHSAVATSATALAWSTAFLIIFPATFVLLPITRRRAKVRAAHFARITAYSLFIPYVVFWIVVAIGLLWAAFPIPMIEFSMLMTLVLPLPMAWVWWYFAIKRHLRLPHALWLVAIMSIVSILLIPSTLMVIYYVLLFLNHVGWIAPA